MKDGVAPASESAAGRSHFATLAAFMAKAEERWDNAAAEREKLKKTNVELNARLKFVERGVAPVLWRARLDIAAKKAHRALTGKDSNRSMTTNMRWMFNPNPDSDAVDDDANVRRRTLPRLFGVADDSATEGTCTGTPRSREV